MDEELARIIATAAMRSSSGLGELLHILEDHCSFEEYEELRSGIASATAEIGIKVLNPVFKRHPHIEEEFARNVAKYGRTS